MAMVRNANGQLIEEEQQPGTPASAAAQGATPASAAMHGSSAQKNNAIQQAVDPNQTLQAKQRYDKPAPTQAEVEDTNTSKGSRLAKLGGLAGRVDSMLFQKQQEAQGMAGTLAVDFTGKNIDPEAQASVQAYMDLVNSGSTDQASIQAAQATMNDALAKNSTPIDPAQFLQESGVTLGQQYTDTADIDPTLPLGQLIGEGLSVGDTLGYEGGDLSLAEDLGIDPGQLGTLTVEDIQQRMRDIEAEDFSRVESLKAEMVNASPDRREALRAELEQLGATGATGLEASVDNLNTILSSADVVEFAGQSMPIKDMMENDFISDAILAAVRDPDAMARLSEEEPALAKWAQENKDSLEQLSTNIEQQSQTFKDVQADYQEAVSNVDETITQLVTGENADSLRFVTQDELGSIKSKLESSGIFAAAQSSPELNVAIKDAIGSDNTEITDWLKTATSEDIDSAYEAVKELDSDGPVGKITGIQPDGPFLTPSQMTQFNDTKELVGKFGENTKITEDPQFVDMVKDGTLTADEADWIVEKGDQEWDELKEWVNEKKELQQASSMDDTISAILGDGHNVDSVSKALEGLESVSKWDPAAAEKYKAMQSFFDKDKDGVVDDDMAGLKDRVSKAMGGTALEAMTSGIETSNKELAPMKTSYTPGPEVAVLQEKARGISDKFYNALQSGNMDFRMLKRYRSAEALLPELVEAGVLDPSVAKQATDRWAEERAVAKKLGADQKASAEREYWAVQNKKTRGAKALAAAEARAEAVRQKNIKKARKDVTDEVNLLGSI